MDTKLIREYSRTLGVLIVDDEIMVLETMSRILSRLFKKVYTASNGLEGLEMWKNNRENIDLVISDITMPELNGVEFAKELKKIYKDIKIFMVSAHSESKFLLELINLGVEGFIIKPIDKEQLLTQVYNVSKSLSEHKAIVSYQKGLENYLDYVVKQSLKLSKVEAVLKGIIEEYTDEQVRELLRIARKHNADTSPILHIYGQKKKGVKINLVEIINAEFAEKTQKKNIKSDIGKVCANEYLEKIEFDKYFQDVQDELSYLRELAIDIYELLEFSDMDEDIIRKVGELYTKYASSLFKFSDFNELASSVHRMANFYKNVDIGELFKKTNMKNFKNIALFFMTDLENWKSSVFDRKDAIDIHYLDKQSVSIAEQLENIMVEDEEDVSVIMF